MQNLIINSLIFLFIAIGGIIVYYIGFSNRYLISWIIILFIGIVTLLFFIKEKLNKVNEILLTHREYTYKPY